MSPAFFEVTRTGEVLSRLTTDTTLIQVVIGTSMSMALRNMLLLIGGLVMLAITSPRLTSYTIGMLLVVVLPIVIFGRRVRKLSRHRRIGRRCALAGARLARYRPCGRSRRRARRELRRPGRGRSTSLRISTRATLTAIMIVMVFGAIVLVLWLGARDRRLDDAVSSPVRALSVMVAGSIGALSEWSDIQRAAATERLMGCWPRAGDRAPPNPVPAARQDRIRPRHVHQSDRRIRR